MENLQIEKLMDMNNMEELVIAMAEIVKENRRLRSKLEQLTAKETEHLMKKHIEFLELSPHVYRALLRGKIETIGQLCSKTYGEVSLVRCMGDGSMSHLQEKMNVYGLHFKDRN